MTISTKKFFACFDYDERGRGDLVIDNQEMLASVRCRTGHIDDSGKLIDSIPTGIWTGREEPVQTHEIAMVVDDLGWKYRLWTPEGKWSHYLIHPDGNKPGSLGCIVPIKYNCKWLYELLGFIHKKQGVLEIDVGRI